MLLLNYGNIFYNKHLQYETYMKDNENIVYNIQKINLNITFNVSHN